MIATPTVLRGGKKIASLPVSRIDGTGQLIELMVSRPLAELFPPRNETLGDVIFSAHGLTRRGVFEDINFEVRAGEVLGVAGLVGAGRTEVMCAIFGADPLGAERIEKAGEAVVVRQPWDAIEAGIAYLPEDHKEHGLALELSGQENMVMASRDRVSRSGLVAWPRIRRVAQDLAERLRFQGRIEAPAPTNSGDNKKMLVIGKWVATGADILIFDEPTRGIDIGARSKSTASSSLSPKAAPAS